MTETPSPEMAYEEARVKFRRALSEVKRAGNNVASASLDRDRLEETFGHGDNYTEQIRQAQKRYEDACHELREAEEAYQLAKAEYDAAFTAYRASK